MEYFVKRDKIRSECFSLLEKVKEKYPDYTFFVSTLDPDYIIIRKVMCQSKFYRNDDTSFFIDVTSQEKIHYEELKYLV